MLYTILIGGAAGQGPNILANLVSKGLIDKGFFVFSSREYESRIRGGHNFNLVTFSDSQISSNPYRIDLLVCLDGKTEEIHKKRLNNQGAVISGSSDNAFYAGKIFKILNLDFKFLDKEFMQLKNYEQNIKSAKQGYDSENNSFSFISKEKEKISFLSGNEAIAEGAIKSGLDFYYAYPMTPATGVLTELSRREKNEKYTTVELEGEISCINAAIGSAVVGAKSMAGSSGGGFDLMTESLSLSGMAEIPLVFYLSQRPGPSTGLATYTSQGDLNMALHSGHGEFVRIVIAPGEAKEAIEKTSEIFYFTQKYKIPGILISDKHLVESYHSFLGEPRITFSGKSIKWPSRFNSYESDENKIATEDPEIIKRNVNSRIEKVKKIREEIENFEPYKIFGNPESKNLIVSWGSTKGAIIDSISGKDCKFLQIIYLEPFSNAAINEIKKATNLIVIENNSTSPLSSLITEKSGVIVKDENKILKFDGRPFLSDEISEEIQRRLK